MSRCIHSMTRIFRSMRLSITCFWFLRSKAGCTTTSASDITRLLLKVPVDQRCGNNSQCTQETSRSPRYWMKLRPNLVRIIGSPPNSVPSPAKWISHWEMCNLDTNTDYEQIYIYQDRPARHWVATQDWRATLLWLSFAPYARHHLRQEPY